MNSLPPPPQPAPVVNEIEPPQPSADSPVAFAARLLTFCLLAAMLYWGRAVAIPLALAILLSFTLKPIVRRLQRCFVPRVLAVMASVSFACVVVGSLGWLIGSQLIDLSTQLPGYRTNIAAKVKSVRNVMKGGAVERIQKMMEKLAAELNDDKNKPNGGPDADTQSDTSLGQKPPQEPVPVTISTPKKLIDLDALSALLPLVDPLTTAVLVLVLVVMMLLRWEDLRSRIISFSGHQNLTMATRACDDAGQRISRYLTMQLMLNGSYGLVFAIGLSVIGVPYASLWGLCAGLFRYLPYVGPTIGAALPVLYSLMTSVGWAQPFWVGGLILVMELVSNNLLEPWLYGSQLGLSEVGLIMAAVGWTFLWGPLGLVMATPLTVCLVVLGEYIPAFSVFSRLLGDMTVLELHCRFYQRLLARDEIEAREIARRLSDEIGVGGAIDELFVPTLALAERDQLAGLLAATDEENLGALIEQIFERLHTEAEKGESDSEAEAEAKPITDGSGSVSIIIWPVVPLAGSAATLLKWLLRQADAEVSVLSSDILSAEAGDLARTKKPAVFCILSLVGGQARRERQIAKRIVAAIPDVPVIVARLGPPGTLKSEDRDDLTSAGAAAVTHTLGETFAAMRPFIQQASLKRAGGER